MTGKEDSQWVALTGVGRSQTVRENRTILTLTTQDGSIKVTVPEATQQPAPHDFTDAQVEVHGVCTTAFNQRRQLQGVELHAPSWTEVQIHQAAPESIAALPVQRINELLRFQPNLSELHRTRLQGVLTHRCKDGSAFIQDGAGGIRVQPKPNSPRILPGVAVDAVGFPGIFDRLPVLQDAVVQASAHSVHLTPLQLEPAAALNALLHGTLVRLEGELIVHSSRTGEEMLTVAFGRHVIDAILEKETRTASLTPFERGTRVRLTGVYIAKLDENAAAASFQLLLRDPGDVFVVSQPAWWTGRRFLWGLEALGLVLASALIWVALLRRQVRERTRELREEISERRLAAEQLRKLSRAVEQSPSSIVITDAQGRIEYVNPKFSRLTGYSSEEVIGHTPALQKSGLTPIAEYQRMWAVILAGREWRGEFQNRKKNGDLYWEAASISPITNESGTITHFVAVKEDITESKLAEDKLEQTQRLLLQASRQAGMAEVATSVLHNVGNVLNSVNVSATLVADRIRHSKTAGLPKVVALLREHSGDLAQFIAADPRGQQVTGYLSQLADHLAAEQSTLLRELGSLTQNLDHIKEIVAMQQEYAKVSGLTETVSVVDLVEDALRMNLGALARHDVRVARHYEPQLPILCVEKHKVLQILVNLIRNAKYACDESGRKDKELVLRIARTDGGVRIEISDNGIGIPAENVTRIFQHGFTTRRDGHGFGLHSGALAARELGGQLSAHSAGPLLGATFTLELPLQPPKTPEPTSGRTRLSRATGAVAAPVRS
ncbi:MAG: PAS domain S-box protein [Verrucomicrobiota bacterium]